jgi:hypothetical protein
MSTNPELLPAVIPQSPSQEMEFGVPHNPVAFMKHADVVAAEFKVRAEKLQLYKQISQSKHLLVEGWQMLGWFYQLTASIESTRYVDFGNVTGWEATATLIYIPTGRVVSRADAMCLDDEDNWGPRPKYDYETGPNNERRRVQTGTVPTPTQQLRSMAQTRACSKVYSNLLKFVARMAGFATTPAEEMTGNERAAAAGGNSVAQPGRKSQAGPIISEAQGKRFVAIAKGSGWSREQQVALLSKHGIEHVWFKDDNGKEHGIPKSMYDNLCSIVGKPPVADAAPDPSSDPNPPSERDDWMLRFKDLREARGADWFDQALTKVIGNADYNKIPGADLKRVYDALG